MPLTRSQMTVVPNDLSVTIEHVPTISKNTSKLSLNSFKKHHKMSRPLSRNTNE